MNGNTTTSRRSPKRIEMMQVSSYDPSQHRQNKPQTSSSPIRQVPSPSRQQYYRCLEKEQQITAQISQVLKYDIISFKDIQEQMCLPVKTNIVITSSPKRAESTSLDNKLKVFSKINNEKIQIDQQPKQHNDIIVGGVFFVFVVFFFCFGCLWVFVWGCLCLLFVVFLVFVGCGWCLGVFFGFGFVFFLGGVFCLCFLFVCVFVLFFGFFLVLCWGGLLVGLFFVGGGWCFLGWFWFFCGVFFLGCGLVCFVFGVVFFFCVFVFGGVGCGFFCVCFFLFFFWFFCCFCWCFFWLVLFFVVGGCVLVFVGLVFVGGFWGVLCFFFFLFGCKFNAKYKHSTKYCSQTYHNQQKEENIKRTHEIRLTTVRTQRNIDQQTSQTQVNRAASQQAFQNKKQQITISVQSNKI
ncbi:Hypothetical_protein [Hexamita inflata]|uniref:Hypothetical_protein n=1 Tax=Hexamita inflata TaxID=28002 RepID=A0AA86QGC5_9EUKA|nr:Hypothetical protein HINF_LOCUS40372 [Hexamita inflata]